GHIVKGDVVVVPFPFSAAESGKRRPALIVASWLYEHSQDYLLCIITSQNAPDPFLLPLTAADMAEGALLRTSYLCPTCLFTADEGLIVRKIGAVTPEKLSQAIGKIVGLFL